MDALAGVQNIDAHESGKTTVVYDSSTVHMDDIRQAIEKAGFGVENE